MSIFAQVQKAPVDSIFGINLAFQADPCEDKLNLGVGAYRTEDGKPWILPTVKLAEQKILSNGMNHEYLPIDGYPDFLKAAQRILFGDDIHLSQSKKICTVQGLSGTGSLRVGAEFLKKVMSNTTVYISDPTWANHKNVFHTAGLPWKEYRYYDKKISGLDWNGMSEDLKAAPNGSIILLHVCAHNPTGCDPTQEQWHSIADILQEKKHFPFFDCAYQGFASGDLDRDAWPIRMFVGRGIEFVCAQSFAKNMGLYGERVGALHVYCNDESMTENVRSQLKIVIRAMYSNPPAHGAFILATIMNDPDLCHEWKNEMKIMSSRINGLRKTLVDELKARNTPGDWNHIITQIGMFCYTGLSGDQVLLLTNKYHIYLTVDGRISMAGLNEKSCSYLAAAMYDAITTTKA